MPELKVIFKKPQWYVPVLVMTLALGYYWLIHPVYPNTVTTRYEQAFLWMTASWGFDGSFAHGWAVPVLFIVFTAMAWKKMRVEPVKGNWLGLLVVGFGILLYLLSARTLQPRVSQVGIPFLVFGSMLYLFGWRVARHMLFPAFFWWFGISVPGLQQATNFLQVAVTKSCYTVGSSLGMELVNAGSEIRSATDKWGSLDIAEGCSGIRSLMALVMISAIYAYLTQDKVWKMALLFACALPLALVANFFRIFTIIVLAEFGFSGFAAGVYHDWAGLLFFFPIALTGLFLADKLLNWHKNRKIVRTRVHG